MEAKAISKLWTTFSPEMRQQITYLWIDLLHRQIQNLRLLPRTGDIVSNLSKIKGQHVGQLTLVYIRQSTHKQVQLNPENTRRSMN